MKFDFPPIQAMFTHDTDVEFPGAKVGDSVVLVPEVGAWIDGTPFVNTVTAASAKGTLATLTAAHHGLQVGQQIEVVLKNDTYNGSYKISAVTEDTFSYEGKAPDGASATGRVSGNLLDGGRGMVWIGFVKKDNKVTIRLMNTSGKSPSDPTSTTFRVTVIKH